MPVRPPPQLLINAADPCGYPFRVSARNARHDLSTELDLAASAVIGGASIDRRARQA